MSTVSKPSFKSIGLDKGASIDDTIKIVDEHAKTHNVPKVVFPASAAAVEKVTAPSEAASVTPISDVSGFQGSRRRKGKANPNTDAPSPVKRMAVDLPLYLISAIREKAAKDDITVRYIITRALRKDGFNVESRDLIEDGRREQ